MNEKKVPFKQKAKFVKLLKTYPTPFHIYDEEAIRANVRKLIKAFDWAKDFKEIFCCKGNAQSVYYENP